MEGGWCSEGRSWHLSTSHLVPGLRPREELCVGKGAQRVCVREGAQRVCVREGAQRVCEGGGTEGVWGKGHRGCV